MEQQVEERNEEDDEEEEKEKRKKIEQLSKFLSNLLRVQTNMLATISCMRGSVTTPPAPEALPLRLIAQVAGFQRRRHSRRGGLDGLLH